MLPSIRISFEQINRFLQGRRGWLEKSEPHPYGYAIIDALAHSQQACGLLSQVVPEVRAGKWRLLSFKIRKIQQHHRKRIIRGLLSYQNGKDNSAQTEEIVVKVYGSDRGGKALETLKQLRKAGFCSPAKYRVPRPYGYLPQEGALLQGTAPGTSWATLVRTDDPFLATGSVRAADWLIRLQDSKLDGEPKSPEDAVESVRRWSQELSMTFPKYAQQLGSISERLSLALQADSIPLVPSHGDYHPMNIFLTPALTTVIDFDTFALREAAFDAGYSIGQLLIMSYFQTGAFDQGAGAALAFWNHYRSSGQAPWNRVAIQIARTFLQSLHYELYTLHNNHLELLHMWTNLMEAWMDNRDKTMSDGLKAIPLQGAGVR